jgi:retinol-binding protein 3
MAKGCVTSSGRFLTLDRTELTHRRGNRMSRSRCTVPGIAALFFLLSVPARAQDLTGRWAGRMEPENLSAEIELHLARTERSWSGAMTFRAGPNGGALAVEELRVEGEAVFVRTRIEGADVNLQLTLDDSLLLGSVRVTEGDRVLAEGPVGLARAADAKAQERLMSWLDAQGSPIDAARRHTVIERSIELMLVNYAFADRAERAATDVRARAQRGEYDAVGTTARLAELLGRHLADATSDRHVQVKFGAERVADPRATVVETKEDLARLRRDAEAEGFGIGARRVLGGNVGYLELTRFFRAEHAGDALAAAMQELASTDALIVDLRASRGGDPVMVVLAASWFFDGRPRHWNDMHRRLDGTTTQMWTSAWLPGARYVEKPVFVLTAQSTFSAPESLAYELQQTRRATIVGETTGGGAHPGAWFPIDDRFAIFIPLSRYVSSTSGGDWEGVGVEPDIACDAADALERAHHEALARLGRE